MTATKHKTSLSFLALGVFLFIILLANANAVTLGQSNLTDAIKLGSPQVGSSGTIYINNTYNNITIYNITGGNISGTCKLGEICYGDSNLNNSITSTSNITTSYSTVSNGTALFIGKWDSGVNQLELGLHKDRLRFSNSAWSYIDFRQTAVPFSTMNMSIVPYSSTSFWNWNINQYSNKSAVFTGNVTADWFKGKVNYSDIQNVPSSSSADYTNVAWQNQSNNFTEKQNFFKGIIVNVTLNVTNKFFNETILELRMTDTQNATFSNTSLILRHAGRDTTNSGITVRADPQFLAGEAMYIQVSNLGSAGRLYFTGITSTGALVSLYSMDFTNVLNWVNVPSRIGQQTTADNSYCIGRSCSYVGNTASDLILGTGGGGAYISPMHGTQGIVPFTFVSYVNKTSQYNTYQSAYTFGVNGSRAEFNSTSFHSKWTINNTRENIATLDASGNYQTNGNITNNGSYISNNKVGKTTSVRVVTSSDFITYTSCTLNITGGIVNVDSTC